jgi:hypothetical protein
MSGPTAMIVVDSRNAFEPSTPDKQRTMAIGEEQEGSLGFASG